jgi:hypothetical protein
MSVSAPRTVHIVEYRGPCALCGLDVTTAHKRTLDESGKYVHIECFEASQARAQQVLSSL